LKVQDDLTVTDDVAIGGLATVGGTLGVTGVLTATSLDISGDIDVDGTTNLDVVDIDGAVDMASTLQVDGAITSSAGATITVADNSDNLTLTSTDADANAGPNFRMFRNSSSPADGDAVGLIEFEGKNDADQTVRYAGIDSRIVDASNGTEDGSLELVTTLAGTGAVSRVFLGATETVFNDNSKDLDFRVESDGNTHMLFVDAGNNRIGVGNDSPNRQLSLKHATQAEIGFKTGSVSNGGLIYYNDSEGKLLLRAQESSDVIAFETGGTTERMRIDSDGGTTITRGDNGAVLTLKSTDTDASRGPILDLNRESASSAADNDYIGEIRFMGNNDANESIAYAGIAGRIIDASDGTEDGRFEMYTELAGAQTSRILADATETVINQDSADLDFRVESDGNANMLFVDGGNDVVNVGGVTVEAGDAFSIHGSGTNTVARIYNTNDGGDGSIFIFQKASSSPGDQDVLGDIRFHGNDSGGTMTQFARIMGISDDVTNGTEDGELRFETVFNGTTREVLQLGRDSIFNEAGQDIGFRIESNGNANMLVVDAGNNFVGVGTSAPAEMFHVFHPSNTAAIRVSGENNANRKCQIEYNASDGPIIRSGSSGITSLKFAVDNATLAGKFDTNADFYTNDGTVHSLSDIRVKTDVEDLIDGLDIVKQLKPRTFRYTEDSEFYNENTKDEVRYGFVANEVEAVAPQYTDTGKGKIGGKEVDDLKSLSTTKMIPMLVKAIQEQQEQIEELKAKIATLKGE